MSTLAAFFLGLVIPPAIAVAIVIWIINSGDDL